MRRYAPQCLLGLVPLIALAALVACATGVVDPDAILAHRDALRARADAGPLVAVATFMAAYFLGMSLALPLGGVLGLMAGFLFGQWLGLGLLVATGTLSALAVFWAARGAWGEWMVRRAGPVYRRGAAAMRDNAFAYLLFMRIVPVFPFFIVTLAAAMFGVRTRTFLLATLLGKVPAAFIYAGLGHELGRADSVRDLMSLPTLLGLSALGLLALTPILYRAVRSRPAVVLSP